MLFRSINASTVDGEVITGGGLNLSNNGSIDIPEPATLMLLTTGLAGFGLRLRRLRRHPGVVRLSIRRRHPGVVRLPIWRRG